MKILLATDGSEFSRAAIKACCDLAVASEHPEIKVISVYEPQVPMASQPFAVSAEYYTKLDEIAKERAQAAADDAVEEIKTACKDAAPGLSARVEFGHPAEVIIDAANDWGADLVIVGSHGRGFWGRLTLGSVSDAVVHHAACSVLVAR